MSTLVAALLGLSSLAHADDDDATQHVSLTLSPIHLLLPIVEVSGELRAGELLGVAVIGGVGSVSAETSSGEEYRFSAFELGGQLAVYPLEPFRSLQLGLELLYLHVSVEDEIGGAQVSGLGAGFALGPLIGYKLLTSIGFTFVAQLGVSFLAVQAEAENDQGRSATVDDNRVLPLLNLNVGWSF